MKLAMLVLACLLVAMTTGDAKTIYIPQDYSTIQQGIDVAANGDTVFVAPGTYVENIDFLGKAITVKSSGGASVTVIDGNQAGSVVTFQSGEGPDSVLEGFTLTNGSGTGPIFFGGGIMCDSSSPTITHNTITGNTASIGGGIYCHYSSPTITNNVISVNIAFYGGGISCYESFLTITNNVISGNSAKGNGGGIFCTSSSPTITNNTITGNSAQLDGGGIYCWDFAPTITNTILWDNSSPTGPEIYVASGNPVVTYCDVKDGWTGPGNIDVDPLFVDSVNNDFHLTWRSPCINRGTNDGAPSEDFDGYPRPTMGTVDVGVDEFAGIHALESKVFSLSEATGGIVNFTMNGGAGNGKKNYIILGSITGNAPGKPLPGGNSILPINWDIFTLFIIEFINTAVFPNFMGTLMPDGTGTAAFNTIGPMLPGMAGNTFSFAYAVQVPGWDFVSNPVGIEIVP